MCEAQDVQQIVATIQRVIEHLGLRHHDRTGRDYFTAYGETLYDWELYFDGIALAYFCSDVYAINGIHIFLSEQDVNGFIRRNSHGTTEERRSIWGQFEAQELCKPFLCQLALTISRMRGDASWLGGEAFGKLQKVLHQWLSAWDQDGNGLSEWASGPHSGTDTQVQRVGSWGSRYCEGVDLNSYLHRECLAAAELAEALGLADDAEELRRQAAWKKDRIQTLLWDAEDGFFYDRDARSGERIKVKSAATFIPLWAGVATPAQAEELVERHLRNPEEFWTPYPVPSYARSEGAYGQTYEPLPGADPVYALMPGHANWCGGMWPHWNYLIVHGLADYGYRQEARHIAQRFFDAVAADPMLYEWYNAETGEGQGMHPFCAGSTVLGAFLPAELAMDFDPTKITAVHESLDPERIRRALGIERPFRPVPHRALRVVSAPA